MTSNYHAKKRLKHYELCRNHNGISNVLAKYSRLFVILAISQIFFQSNRLIYSYNHLLM